jgi:hypothetical protein
MTAHVSHRIPAKVQHGEGAGDGNGAPVDVEVERFSGALMHPVPRSEMWRRFQFDSAGCKVIAHWCDGAPDEGPVHAGDVLQMEGSEYPIVAVRPVPGYYMELYVDHAL